MASLKAAITKPYVNNQLNTASFVQQHRIQVVSRERNAMTLRSNDLGVAQGLREAGSERLHMWRSDCPGQASKLRVVVKSSMSLVPEKPLGLYDPSFDKDLCGIGFVAELSGESSRKTDVVNNLEDGDELINSAISSAWKENREIMADPQLPTECHVDPHMDYDGAV